MASSLIPVCVDQPVHRADELERHQITKSLDMTKLIPATPYIISPAKLVIYFLGRTAQFSSGLTTLVLTSDKQVYSCLQALNISRNKLYVLLKGPAARLFQSFTQCTDQLSLKPPPFVFAIPASYGDSASTI